MKQSCAPVRFTLCSAGQPSRDGPVARPPHGVIPEARIAAATAERSGGTLSNAMENRSRVAQQQRVRFMAERSSVQVRPLQPPASLEASPRTRTRPTPQPSRETSTRGKR